MITHFFVTKGHIVMVKKMDKELWNLKMEESSKEISSMISSLVNMPKSYIQMDPPSKVH
jgi:hypothetical protein